MKLLKTNKGFTLIELLVVITIIGILAAGGAVSYTSQIQKSRDATRLTDIKALQSSVEQVYQDDSEYPHGDDFINQVITYMERLPKDPKHGQPCSNGGLSGVSNPACAYTYKTQADNNGIDYGEYELSTWFENAGNVEAKGNKDWGGGGTATTTEHQARFEIGIDIDDVDTDVSPIGGSGGAAAITSAGPWSCDLTGSALPGVNGLVIINGNPSSYDPATSASQCG